MFGKDLFCLDEARQLSRIIATIIVRTKRNL
jgi:hypothetical protein